MTSEKFCLRWNDFERNISSAFKDIRDEKEFFDVTIACEDDQLQAHKVILSACSPFFRSVLRRNQGAAAQQLVLYLKGVTYRDMEAVLTFMYHGEVNVAQDDLNSFLAVAEELRVKGLTQNNSGAPSEPPKQSAPPARRRPSEDQHAPTAPKRPRPLPPRPQPPAPPQQVEDDDEIQEFVPVKSEPVAPPQQEVYEQGGAPGGGMMMTTEDSMQYDENYGAYEEGYDEGAYYQEDGAGAGAGAGKEQCGECGRWYHHSSLKRHQKEQHSGQQLSIECTICHKTFTTKSNHGNHMRRQHNIYK